jgi:hypothetical protein
MPVQINELIIRTVVDAAQTSQANQSSASDKSEGSDYDAIEKVLEIIKEKNER